MGKGLSELQTDLLTVLEKWPSFEETNPGSVDAWAKPRDIIVALHRPLTPANRHAINKALARLHARGAVARTLDGWAIGGHKSFRYVKITKPKTGVVALPHPCRVYPNFSSVRRCSHERMGSILRDRAMRRPAPSISARKSAKRTG
jgi:hypothetical protein